MKTSIIALVFFLFFGLNSAVANNFDPPVILKIIEKDFPLFKDMDSRILYIDFELLNLNVKELKIVKQNGELKFNDDVSKREVDTIYEVDYSEYSTGTYTLELHTYLGKVLNSTFIIK
ncbi:hypothetical protein [Portibacter lacus]|nr:hypothetical protein [Portibacter lacus]